MAPKELVFALSCFNELISALGLGLRLKCFARDSLIILKLKIADDKERHEASFLRTRARPGREKIVFLSRRAQIILRLTLLSLLDSSK
jgi:hypothetical protein